LDALTGFAAEIGHDLDAYGADTVDASGGDHDAAVAAAEVVDDVTGLDAARLEHLLDEGCGRGNSRTEVLGRPELLGETGKRGGYDDKRG
jgi:hypothetical protein